MLVFHNCFFAYLDSKRTSPNFHPGWPKRKARHQDFTTSIATTRAAMGENTAPPAPASSGEVPGQPFYDKTRQHLKELLHKKRILERSLSMQEDTIFRKETEYLEETPSGNIITGFEAYTKGTGAASGAARRRGGVSEGSRVFSRSSVSFNPAAVSLS